MQEAALNEVFTGGLSSYSIVNMVMAHLQSVGYPLPTLPDVSTPAEPMTHPSAAHQAHAAAAQLDGVSACEDDVGELLLGFLQCFGSQFDYSQQAVSVREVNNPIARCIWPMCNPWCAIVLCPQLSFVLT